MARFDIGMAHRLDFTVTPSEYGRYEISDEELMRWHMIRADFDSLQRRIYELDRDRTAGKKGG